MTVHDSSNVSLTVRDSSNVSLTVRDSSNVPLTVRDSNNVLMFSGDGSPNKYLLQSSEVLDGSNNV